jgi:hypothetical protein
MSEGSDHPDTALSPDEAFGVLGNETRMAILRTLGEADAPLPFSELRERVGVADSGQFNYHLERVVGHFVRKGADGYALRQAGRRIVEAVLSGAVTESPVVEPTRLDHPCHYCGSPIEVSFRTDRLVKYCTECAGKSGRPTDESGRFVPAEDGYLGALPLPSAGVRERSVQEVFEAAWTWTNVEFLAEANGMCSRCSAPLEESVDVCESHDPGDGLCDRCDSRHAVEFRAACTNCINDLRGPFVLALVADPHLLSFLIDHGLDPIAPSREGIGEIDRIHMNYTEEVRSVDPFDARFTFTANGETLTLTVDDDLSVVDATRRTTSGAT